MIDLAAAPGQIAELLPDHLVEQRWAGAHGRPFSEVVFRWHEVVCQQDDVALVWGVVDATHEDGEVVAYQMFVGLRRSHDLPEFLHGKEREVIGRLTGHDVAHLLVVGAGPSLLGQVGGEPLDEERPDDVEVDGTVLGLAALAHGSIPSSAAWMENQ